MVFGQEYAAGYDALYREKDYGGECDVIERTLGLQPGAQLLDVGCGSGGHALELWRRGYQVTGVDRSGAMLEVARGRAAGATQGRSATPPRFVEGDARELPLPPTPVFDAAVMMFAVLGYLTGNADALAALRGIRQRLRQGGRLGFDVWWGPAVLTDRPGDRVRIVPTEGGQLLRATRTSLDTTTNVAKVHFDLFRLHDDRPATRSEETHHMRYFFGPELQLMLESSGFALERIGQFPQVERDATAESWNVWVVARAV